MDEFRRKPVNRAPGFGNAPGAPAVESSSPTGAANVPAAPAPIAPQLLDEPTGISSKPPKKSKKKLIIWSLAGLLAALLLVTSGVFAWYTVQLSPVDAANTDKKVVSIESGSTPNDIATTLQEQGVIRNATAFLWYTRAEGVQNNLQAGAYRLSPSESTQEIVEHLVSGRVDTYTVTLYPGATLVDATDADPAKKLDVTSSLKRAGYTDAEIQAGLTADYSEYNDTLFQDRPAGSDLEGYIFGETYQLSSGATVEDVIRTSFDELWRVIEENSLVDAFAARGLTLYEGLVLASIIQKEAGTTPDDMAQISQVFNTRYEIGMPLGSDPTYQYIADKTGVARDTNLDSPYNTRRYAGLPPGPIASPGERALIAAASPAEGDYLYFLSGDDNVTYFARTLEEHEANRVNHCQEKCRIL